MKDRLPLAGSKTDIYPSKNLFRLKKFDTLIIGAGIAGLATALQLLRQRPELKLAVFEKETAVAAHQSSRNSGVIHSGIYYRPGSLRAQNCLQGYSMLLDFCREHALPFDICGKIIVATEQAERPQLDMIYQRGIANGLNGLRKIGPEEIAAIEPHVRAVEAVWVPQAGITNYGQVTKKYAELVEQAGGEIHTGVQVEKIQVSGNEVIVAGPNREVAANLVISCAGLYSDQIAQRSGAHPGVQILPFRGEFYQLKPEREHLVRNLIYPVPNPNFPFLGVHFTRMIGGGIEAGPNAVLAFRREGYSRSDVHFGELFEILRFPGFRRLARNHWRYGLDEMRRSFSKKYFVHALQRLIPEIRSEDVMPARSGVRAMACTPEGALLDDFLILEKPRIINVCNAPSPAATASLAVGQTVAERALQQLKTLAQ